MKVLLARGKILVDLQKAKPNTPMTGKIVAFGKGRQLESGRETDLGFSLEIGCMIMMNRPGETVEHDGNVYNIIDYNDAMGRLPQPVPASSSVTNPAKQDPPKINLPKPEAAPIKAVA